jgi:hypothetical protein
MLKRIIHQFARGLIYTTVFFIIALLFSLFMYYLALFSFKLYIIAIIIVVLVSIYLNGKSI